MLTVTIHSYDGVRLPKSFKGTLPEIIAWSKQQLKREVDPYRIYFKVTDATGQFGLSHQWRTAEEAISLSLLDLTRKKPKKLSDFVREMESPNH